MKLLMNLLPFLVLVVAKLIQADVLMTNEDLLYKKLKYITTFADPEHGYVKNQPLSTCGNATLLEYEYTNHLETKQKELSTKRRINVIFLFIGLAICAFTIIMVHACEFATQQIETLKQFRAVAEFRRRFFESINTLERKLGIDEIDFTFRSRNFVYPDDVVVPPHMQMDDGPLPSKSKRASNVAFPHLDEDEDEHLEGRTDYHAFEHAAGCIRVISMSKIKVGVLFLVGLLNLVIGIGLMVNWMFGTSTNYEILVELCQIEIQFKEKVRDCLPFMNAYTQEQLDMYLSWERGLLAERVWGLGFVSFVALFAAFVMLAVFYHGSQQLSDGKNKDMVHIPNSLFGVYLVSFMTTVIVNVALFGFIMIFSNKIITTHKKLTDCSRILIDPLPDFGFEDSFQS